MRVDSREPKHIARYFRKKGWNVHVGKFAEAGDIADDDLRIVIERKHGTDLIASIFDNRLMSQCDRLYHMSNTLGCLTYVVISGNIRESIASYENYVRRGLQKSRHKRIPKKTFDLKIRTSNIYKTLSLLPWHYDVNVLWFIDENEALETIHYMLQEVSISDPFSKVLKSRKRSKAKKKKNKTRRTTYEVLSEAPETDIERFKRLGLI